MWAGTVGEREHGRTRALWTAKDKGSRVSEAGWTTSLLSELHGEVFTWLGTQGMEPAIVGLENKQLMWL